MTLRHDGLVIDRVHMAPEGVTGEHFDITEHPTFPCGAIVTLESRWKPRLWQVTCVACATNTTFERGKSQ